MWPLSTSIAVFAGTAVVIALAGTRLVRLVDQLADRTGLGEAFFGMALLGGLTSLSGVVLSMTAALGGEPQLAVSNAVGGIAVQTLFLVVADVAYRGANLEHAAPSLPNLISSAILVLLLALALAAAFVPDATVLAVHPVSPLIIAGYVVGLRLVHNAHEHPWWTPSQSPETREDVPDDDADDGSTSTAAMFAQVAVLAAVTGVAGWALARAGSSLSARTALSVTAVGTLFTAVTTSLPELVTTLAAVRRGALTLAIGGIVGGNAFDVLNLPLTDAAYRAGSVYHAIGPDQLLVIAMTMAMTAVLLLGLLTRQRRGVLGVGGEGLLIVLLYVATLALVATD